MNYRFLVAALFVFSALQVNGQTLQWEDYSPVSTLEVEENPITRAKYRFVDAHAHQWRIGTATAEEIRAMVAEMDAMNLVTMVNLSGGSGEELLQKIQNTEAHAPGRFVHYANIDFSRVGEPGFGKAAARQLELDVHNGAAGLKIFKNLGMTVVDADGVRVPADDPRLDPIWAKCGELGIPVLIHIADPEPFWFPHDKYNERWFELKERPGRKQDGDPTWDLMIEEQWNVFRKHPETTFFNAHLGWFGNNLKRMGDSLDVYPNVYTELGAVVAELGRQPHTARQWLIDYQDRVLMGKDSWEPSEYHVYFRIFETADEFFPYYRKRHAWWTMYGLDLPDEVLRKIYYKNALKTIPAIDETLYEADWNVAHIPEEEPRLSPLQLARTQVGDAYVKVHYSSPRKRGREIFGGLVPYGELWRTAANEATEITFTADVRVGGQVLSAGTYSLFSIPDRTQWTLILNSGLGQNGTGQYDEEQDVLRVRVPVTEMDVIREAFAISFEEQELGVNMIVEWDRVRVEMGLSVP